jgi:hypothetical protein|tara:strand:+ start:207 stop:410 length:204 start_codon:yes stop_codon:yes gene_type:complete
MSLRVKLIQRMDALQQMMESNLHLSDPETVLELLDKVKFAWSALSEEDREYIEGVEYAIEAQSDWDV